MPTLEQAMVRYFQLSRREFARNNPGVLPVFSSAAVALATQMWVDGIDMNPATFYIALIGEPRTGKSSFLRHYFRLFRGTVIEDIPIGSPEAMLKAIDSIKHGYVWYDEVAHLAKLIDSYMGTLPTILNKAYYLDVLSQVRVDLKKSVVVPAESYFIHVYFAGTPSDWSQIERKAAGGFIRRTLVINVRGIIPFFKKRVLTPEEERERAKLYNAVREILELLTYLRVTVYLPEFPKLAELLEKEQIDNEKKSMIEEYFYKVYGARVLANLITFDINDDPQAWTVNDILSSIVNNAKKRGIKVELSTSAKPPFEVVIHVPELNDAAEDNAPLVTLDDFLRTASPYTTYKMLVDTVKPYAAAPDSVTIRNVERIKQWLESGGAPVVSMKKFAREILHTGSPQYYQMVLQILEEAGYIRMVEFYYRGRPAKYVILDTNAKICANCVYYRDLEHCPRLRGFESIEEAKHAVPPWEVPCEKFRLAEEDEEVKDRGVR